MVQVLTPGVLTTVQDLGRWGFQDVGVPVAGPMDAYSHRLANRLVGNDEGLATLEVTLIGPDLEFDDETICAVAGALFPLDLGGRSVPMHVAFDVGRGSCLRFGMRQKGTRAYLAIAGGVDVPAVLGSRATHLVGRTGPFGGRALERGDRLPVGTRKGTPAGGEPVPLPDREARLRVLWGPQNDYFSDETRAAFCAARYQISPRSSRMGYQLEGPSVRCDGAADVLSDATPMGSIQVPASGQPILLMAERPTTGGYPKIATVITADLSLAGQLGPGDRVQFEACDRATAVAALRDRERRLAR